MAVPLPPISPPVLDTVDTVSEIIKKDRPGIKAFPGRVKNFFKDEEKKPLKAMYLSFAVPGLGQAYNGKHWKIPLAWAGLGSLSYAVAWNTRFYKRFKTAYIYRVDGDENTVDEFATTITSDAALKTNRDNQRKNVERAYMGLIGFYLLQGADAFVDAHLSTFNVTDDLSFRVKPKMETAIMNQGIFIPSIALAFSFEDKPVAPPSVADFERWGGKTTFRP